jgi:anaerobic magnesium-protoporphyrin IX monomethyl ester cyclase
MKKQPVVFVASQEYSNLGIGYMAALLSEAGFKSTVIDIRNTKEKILDILKKLDPVLIGFSVIYQYHIDWFVGLVSYLRDNGIKNHMTAGGHYASLRYEELFKFIPSLDSIVRFEGEYTITELVRCVHSGTDWRKIKNVVYKDGNKVISNPLRPPESNLDRFPYPFRSPLPEYAFRKKAVTLLAGRGCVYNCSFCNQKEYHHQSGGPAKRIRRPEMVVEEMEYLYQGKECSIFLLDDDDFPVKSNHGSEWVLEFCSALKNKGLNNKILWKINCRPDEVDEEIFRIMKENGLFLVFLGIEDGTDTGLKRLNKQMTVAKCLKGINTLKKLKIGFEYGFLLFQPNTTFRSVEENLVFLKKICGDGYTPATFLKLMPYYNTGTEKELYKEGRIKGKPGFFDYDFLEDSMNDYYRFIIFSFLEWLRAPDGLVNISKWARNYFAVYSGFFDYDPVVAKLFRRIIMINSKSNIFLLDTMTELSCLFESGYHKSDHDDVLKRYIESIKSHHENYCKQINDTMTELLLFARNHQNINVY